MRTVLTPAAVFMTQINKDQTRRSEDSTIKQWKNQTLYTVLVLVQQLFIFSSLQSTLKSLNDTFQERNLLLFPRLVVKKKTVIGVQKTHFIDLKYAFVTLICVFKEGNLLSTVSSVLWSFVIPTARRGVSRSQCVPVIHIARSLAADLWARLWLLMCSRRCRLTSASLTSSPIPSDT